jgi:hypothetical protein
LKAVRALRAAAPPSRARAGRASAARRRPPSPSLVARLPVATHCAKATPRRLASRDAQRPRHLEGARAPCLCAGVTRPGQKDTSGLSWPTLPTISFNLRTWQLFPMPRGTRVLAGLSRAFECSAQLSENRRVPGSSPGLAFGSVFHDRFSLARRIALRLRLRPRRRAPASGRAWHDEI